MPPCHPATQVFGPLSSRSNREMGRSSWGRDLPTFSILFPKGRLLFMVLFHSSHFPPAILLSTVLATVLATVRLFPQCLLTWGFLQIFWSLFIFYHTPRPLLSRPRLLCNLQLTLLLFWCISFFTFESFSFIRFSEQLTPKNTKTTILFEGCDYDLYFAILLESLLPAFLKP